VAVKVYLGQSTNWVLDYDLHIDRSISFLLSPNVITGKVSVVVWKQDQHQHSTCVFQHTSDIWQQRVVLEETLSGKEGHPIWTWEVIKGCLMHRISFLKGLSRGRKISDRHTGCEHVDEPDHCKFPCHVIFGQISWNWPRVLLKSNCWFTFTQIGRKNSNQRFMFELRTSSTGRTHCKHATYFITIDSTQNNKMWNNKESHASRRLAWDPNSNSLYFCFQFSLIHGCDHEPSPTSTNHWSILEHHTQINDRSQARNDRPVANSTLTGWK